jgi:hypothetical protein
MKLSGLSGRPQLTRLDAAAKSRSREASSSSFVQVPLGATNRMQSNFPLRKRQGAKGARGKPRPSELARA